MSTPIPPHDLRRLTRIHPDALHRRTATVIYGGRPGKLYTESGPTSFHNRLLEQHPEIVEQVLPPEVYRRVLEGDPVVTGDLWGAVSAYALLGRVGGAGRYQVVSVWPAGMAGIRVPD